MLNILGIEFEFMQITVIENLEDVRLEPYRHLRTKNLTRFSGRFIAESRPLVQRLIDSDYEIESILIDDSYLAEAESWVPPSIPVLALPHTWIDELLGFHFHRGFLACGIRKPLVEFHPELASSNSRTWVGAFAIGVQDPENLGVILRTCAGLGIQDCLLGPGTADPLSRRVLRVSMGGVLKLNLFFASDPLSLLTTLHSAGIDSLATSLQEPSEPLETFRNCQPTMVLLGNEANGLPEELQRACSHRVKIAMELNTDSLNVSVAAGIVLHYLRRMRPL